MEEHWCQKSEKSCGKDRERWKDLISGPISHPGIGNQVNSRIDSFSKSGQFTEFV